jgi:hypothetical protein
MDPTLSSRLSPFEAMAALEAFRQRHVCRLKAELTAGNDEALEEIALDIGLIDQVLDVIMHLERALDAALTRLRELSP